MFISLIIMFLIFSDPAARACIARFAHLVGWVVNTISLGGSLSLNFLFLARLPFNNPLHKELCKARVVTRMKTTGQVAPKNPLPWQVR